MNDLQREKILTLVWEAISLAAKGEEIPMPAQLKADEIEAEIDKVTAAPSADSL